MTRRTQIVWALLILEAALVGCSSLNGTHTPTAEFVQANEAYGRGDYLRAVRGYDVVLERDGYSAPVLYDLGNAWLQLRQPGRAILSYERALTIAPSNPTITRNLKFAQQQSGHAPSPATRFESILKFLSLNALASIATVSAVGFAAAVLTARLRRSRPVPLLKTLAIATGLLLLVSGGLLLARAPELDQAVILSMSTPVRVAPADAADTAFILRSGDIVQVGKPYQSYVQVHTDDGRAGWVRAGQLERIISPVDASGRIA